jgi:hypothetical protein
MATGGPPGLGLKEAWMRETPTPSKKLENNLRGFMQYCQSFRQNRSGA